MFYIELESLSSKRWMLNVDKILIVEERKSFTKDELSRIPELKDIDKCCTVILEGQSETFWVKNSYVSIKKYLIDKPKHERKKLLE